MNSNRTYTCACDVHLQVANFENAIQLEKDFISWIESEKDLYEFVSSKSMRFSSYDKPQPKNEQTKP